MYVFLETDHLFNEATTLISKSDEKKEQLQVLEERLQITNNVSRQQIIREGKSLAVRRKLESLQANMEMLYLSIKRRQVAIQSSASRSYTYKYMACVNQIYSASSKQRSNLRRAVSSDKAKLDIIVKQYNELSNEYDSTLFICTTTDTITDGDFPWSRLTGTCNKMFNLFGNVK